MINFFSQILPNQGIYFVAAKEPNRFPHYVCRTVDEMVLKVREIDTQNYDAYFACASFKTESYIDVKGERRQRTAENAEWVKSFWIDIDCGPDKAEEGKGYATINEALSALLKFVDVVGLPKPTVVFSGGGLHVYFLLTEAIAKEEWIYSAHQLKALTQCLAIRLLADDSRTSDIASILRPIGTHNFKPERAGAEVLQKIVGVPIDYSLLRQTIAAAHQTHCIGNRKSAGIQLSIPQSTTSLETPENVAQVKSALASINPDCDHDLWRDVCFALRSTSWSCSEELARSWSRGDLI